MRTEDISVESSASHSKQTYLELKLSNRIRFHQTNPDYILTWLEAERFTKISLS